MKQQQIRRLFSRSLKIELILGLYLFLLSYNEEKSVEQVTVEDETIKPVPGNYNISVPVYTMTRWFKLVIPPNYDHTDPRPLLLVFHGGNLSMGFMFNNRKDLITRCKEENWILVFPNGVNFDDNKGAATWNAVHYCNPAYRFEVDDISFVQKIIDTLSTSLNIDTKSIYAMGGSNGGMFTQRLAAEMPNVFAAVAPNQSTISRQVDSLSPVWKNRDSTAAML